MQLTVKDEESEEVINGITIEDGHHPCLSSLPKDEKLQIPLIEPALWFKTLILTSITIDCVRRTICCNTGEPTGITSHSGPVRRRKPFNNDQQTISESDLERGSVKYHNEGVGEIFNVTREILQKYRQSGNKLQFYEDMFQVLHCYILPIVKFEQCDRITLHAAKESINCLIREKDKQIDEKQGEIEDVSKDQKVIRETVQSNLNQTYCKLKDGEKPPKFKLKLEFVKMLVKGFEKDVQRCYCEFNEAQTSLDVLCVQKNKLLQDTDEHRMKERIRSSFHWTNRTSSQSDLRILTDLCLKNTGLIDQKMAVARAKRDKSHEMLNNILTTKERIQDIASYMEKKKLKPKVKIKTFQHKVPLVPKEDIKAYKSFSEEKESLKLEMMNLVLEKVMQISTREAIASTLDENEVSCSNSGVERCTDVIPSTSTISPHSIPKSWKTTEEQINDTLNDPDSEIAHLHYQSFADFAFRCEIIQKRLELTHADEVTGSDRNGMIQADSIHQAIFEIGHLSIDSFTDQTFAVTALENLNKDVVSYLDNMTQQLLNHLELSEDMHVYIWTCYEKLFFAELGNRLELTYKAVYREKLVDIENIQQLTPCILCINDSPVTVLLENEQLEVATLGTTSERKNNDMDPMTSAAIACVQHRQSSTKRRNHNIQEGSKPNLFPSKSLPTKLKYPVSRTSSKYTSVLNSMKIKQVRKISMSASFDFGLRHMESNFPFLGEYNTISRPLYGTLLKPHPAAANKHISSSAPVSNEIGSLEFTTYQEDHVTDGDNADQNNSLVKGSKVENKESYFKQHQQDHKNGANNTDQIKSLVKGSHVECLGNSCKESSSSDSSESEEDTASPSSNNDVISVIEPDYMTFKDVMRFHNIDTTSPQKEEERSVPKSIKLKQDLQDSFQSVIDTLILLCEETSLTNKLRKGLKAIHQLGEIGTSHLEIKPGEGISTDDLNDLLVVLFCNLDISVLQSLFMSIEFMSALIPEFYDRGHYGYTVVQFHIISHFISTKLEQTRNYKVDHLMD